jgi:hypothetical protein
MNFPSVWQPVSYITLTLAIICLPAWGWGGAFNSSEMEDLALKELLPSDSVITLTLKEAVLQV